MVTSYDAIVVGARCAGAPTAMLLARHGHRVLLVDHASFPSDTLSTHVIQAPGVAALRRWGLLDSITAVTPAVDLYRLDFGPVTVEGTPRPYEGISCAYAPRRTILDKLLVDAAARAGAEVRERFSVTGVLVEDGVVVGIRGHDADGVSTVEKARVVIGADGRHSRLARTVQPETYHAKPPLQYGYYAYWQDLPLDGFEIYVRPHRGIGAIATNDELALIVVGWPIGERDAFRADPEANYLKTLDMVPEFADRVRSATRVERLAGGAVANYFRTPYGPGWVLIGDAAYSKDPITAQGISDAFRDAEACAAALTAVFSGEAAFDDVMRAYQESRDAAALPMYGFTTELATLEPPPPQMQQLFGAIRDNQAAMDDYVSVLAGTVSPAQFFHPDSVGRYLVSAAQ